MHRGNGSAPKPEVVGLSQDRLDLVERYMEDAEEAEARQTPASIASAQPGSLQAREGRRGVDLEEERHERERQSPELAADRRVDVSPAAERVGKLVASESAGGTASRSIGGDDSQPGPLDESRGAADGLGKVAEQADELAEGEGTPPVNGSVDDGVADVHLLESEEEIHPGHERRGEHAAAVPRKVESPSGTDRERLRQRRSAVELEGSRRGHLDGEVDGEPPHKRRSQRAAEAVSRADEEEKEPVVDGAEPPADRPSAQARRRGPRATLRWQTALWSQRTRVLHVQQDGIPADSESRGPMTESFPNRPASLADYLTILRRRAWFIVIPLVLAPIVTYMLAQREKAVYKASSSVYINLTPALSTALGFFNQSAGDPVRYFQTQATLARNPTLIERVASSEKMSPGSFSSVSSVTPSTTANLLIFSVQTGNPGRAATLANAYATAFTRFQPAQDAKTLRTALATLRKKIRSLRARGASTGALPAQESQLESGLVLLSGNKPQVVQPATGAAKVSPRPKHDAMLGLALGLVLGVGLAFLGEALDKRVRSEREIEDILGVPLLARLPTPPRWLRQAGELPILVEPRSPSAEAVKKLRTNLEFMNLDHSARVVMITSALEQEGKSTTIAGLAVALARSGQRVALVDLDLRKPFLHRFFRIAQIPGATDVLTGRRELSDALKPVLVQGSDSRSSRLAPYAHSQADPPSTLAVLPAGPLGPDPAFLVGSPKMTALIEQLKRDWDFVLVDAPPLPAVDDGLALSASMDAVLVVIRSGVVPQRMLQELSRLLSTSPAEPLGFVLTGLGRREAYHYGYGYGYGRTSSRDGSPVIQAPTHSDGERRRRAWSQR